MPHSTAARAPATIRADVRENRKRIAAALGVEPDAFVTCPSNPFARGHRRRRTLGCRRSTRQGRWPCDRASGHRAWRRVRRLRACSLRRRRGPGGRRPPRRLEGRFHGRPRIDHSGHGGPWRAALGDCSPCSAPPIGRHAYEVGPDIGVALPRGGRGQSCASSPLETGRRTRSSICPATSSCAWTMPLSAGSPDLALCTYSDAARLNSYRRSVHHGEPDYGRLISAIALMP
jgi:hypothetical protein